MEPKIILQAIHDIFVSIKLKQVFVPKQMMTVDYLIRAVRTLVMAAVVKHVSVITGPNHCIIANIGNL
jgi:hypothetical protein